MSGTGFGIVGADDSDKVTVAAGGIVARQDLSFDFSYAIMLEGNDSRWSWAARCSATSAPPGRTVP